jgi:hypothetical protein
MAIVAGPLGADNARAGGLELASLLVNKLGVTEKQAEGGAGALFKNAKENLSTDDFQKVSNAVPEMDQYLDAAPSSGASGGVLGKLGSLGGSAGKLGSLAGLGDAFSQLGMESSMISKFAPVVLDYVQSKGGESVAGLLSGLWK